MTDDPDSARLEAVPVSAGLCAVCVHARLVVSGRGSQFVLCEQSRIDPRFPRYPSLPVRACAGHVARTPV
ncbi:MAG TPA: hypothetical protein VM427_07350 [Patescibacteria group bacterium]|nr:hypothetical protein [Patescibacteria group bacterium]